MQWYSITKNVDIDTGEQITNEELSKNYYIIKTTKNVKIEKQTSTGLTEYTNECKRKPKQLELFPIS